jgi:HSP20 family protein
MSLLSPWIRKDVRNPMPSADAFGALQKRIDSMFDDFWRGGDWPVAAAVAGALAPKVDVVENDKAYVVTAELPGLEEKDIELTIDGDRLSLKGEKKSEFDRKDGDWHVSERSYGSFARSFVLPPNADGAKAAAKFDKGVLSVTVPKRAEAVAQVKKIEVKKG